METQNPCQTNARVCRTDLLIPPPLGTQRQNYRILLRWITFLPCKSNRTTPDFLVEAKVPFHCLPGKPTLVRFCHISLKFQISDFRHLYFFPDFSFLKYIFLSSRYIDFGHFCDNLKPWFLGLSQSVAGGVDIVKPRFLGLSQPVAGGTCRRGSNHGVIIVYCFLMLCEWRALLIWGRALTHLN